MPEDSTTTAARTSVRRQHFVPRHYLRQFGYASTEQISLARIDPYQYVARARVGRQCQEDYFYGEDGELESLLGSAEEGIAPVLVEVCRNENFGPKEGGALGLLAVLLHVRTRKAVRAAELFPRKMFFEVIQNAIENGKLPAPKGGWTPAMAGVKGTPGVLMGSAIPCWLEMSTLECKLLIAPPAAAFVTSDHPVLMLNQLAEGAHPLRNFVGFAQSGFQLLLPVSPQHCLYFYDAKAYKAGTRHGRTIKVEASDVEIINALQIQSAEACIYFNGTTPEHRARSLVEKYKGLRRPVEDHMRTLPGRNPNEQFIHQQAPPLKLPRMWAFSRRLNIGSVQPGTRRDPLWTEAIARMMDDLRAGRQHGDIFEHMDWTLAAMANRSANHCS